MTATTAVSERNATWDGLRGIAVAGVLLYHVEGHPLSGGFLGVSMFFTLSGYLITSILVDRLERHGGLGLAAFWARRFRRLLPAMLATIVLCLGFAWFAATANQRDTLPLDAISALTGWSNWRFLFTGAEYGGQQLVTTPFLHTWSLSIELQAYLVVPVILGFTWRRGGRPLALAAIGAITIGTVLAGVLLANDTQQWYLGTHVRAAEILIGAVAAVALHGRRLEQAEHVARRAVPLAVAVLAVMWWVASESDRWLPRGGLMVHAVATLVLVLGVSGGRVGSVLAWRPLVDLGRISYGVYLYHWPIYLWLDLRTLGMGRWPATVVRVALTLALATVSYWVLEKRILSRRAASGRTLLGAAAAMGLAAVAVVVVSPAGSATNRITISGELVAPPAAGAALVLTVPPTPPPPGAATPDSPPDTAAPDVGEPAEPDPELDPDETTTPALMPVPPPPPEAHLDPPLPAEAGAPGRPLRILMIGDSAMESLAVGTQRWASHLGLADVYVSAWLACPVTIGGAIRWNADVVATPRDDCDWRDRRARELRQIQPDLVVIMTGIWEVVDRRLPGQEGFTHIGQPDMDWLIESSLAELTDLMGSSNTRVLWLLHPEIRNSIYARVPGPLPEEDPARMARLNEIILAIAAERPNVWTLDLPAVLADRYPGDPLALVNRSDGFHWSDAGRDVDGFWLAPLLVRVASAPEPAP